MKDLRSKVYFAVPWNHIPVTSIVIYLLRSTVVEPQPVNINIANKIVPTKNINLIFFHDLTPLCIVVFC